MGHVAAMAGTSSPSGAPSEKGLRRFSRLLRYVRPYRSRMVIGIVLLALVGLAEGLIALMITPVFDRILNPGALDSRLVLLRLPSGRNIYLNSFLPPAVHYVWTIFAIAFVGLYAAKAVAEYFGTIQIQYAGLAAVTDLRNRIYEKIVRQPIGFFQQQTTGRLMSTVINDVERVRTTLSETLASLFQQGFTLFSLVIVLLLINWKLALGSAILVPPVLWPVRKLGPRIRRSVESSQARLGDLSQILQETLSGNRVVKAFAMEDFEVARFRAAARNLLFRQHALDSPGGARFSADGLAERGGDRRGAALRPQSNRAQRHDAGNFRNVWLRADQGISTGSGHRRYLSAIRAGPWSHGPGILLSGTG